jgi:prepilin-type processing-associated H-X9-DG protein
LTDTATINGVQYVYGHASYAANSGNAPRSFYSSNHQQNNGIIFGVTAGRPVGIRDVIDGTSNTAAFSEHVKGIGGGGNNAIDSLKPTSAVYSAQIDGTGTTNGQFNDAIPQVYNIACTAANTTSPALATGLIAQGTYYWDGHPGVTLYNHVMTPNTWSCNNNNINDGGAATAASRHSGGINLAMCDGSVRFIKTTVSNVTWWALGTRAGSEVISSDSY